MHADGPADGVRGRPYSKQARVFCTAASDDGATANRCVLFPRRSGVVDHERVHLGIRVKSVEGTHVGAHHVLLCIKVDHWPLTDRCHEDRIAAFALKPQMHGCALASGR